MSGFKLTNSDIGFKASNMKFGANCNIKYNSGSSSSDIDISRYVTSIRAGLRDGLTDIVAAISANLDKAITGSAFGGSDIVESGNLLRSKNITLNDSGDIIISYDVPYANLVHYGGYINVYGSNNKVFIPGRPFIEAALTSGYGLTPPDYYTIILNQLNSN